MQLHKPQAVEINYDVEKKKKKKGDNSSRVAGHR